MKATTTMVRRMVAGAILAGVCALGTGCATTDANNPYYGQTYSQGLPALGQTVAPLARKDAPLNTDPVGSLNKLNALGTLFDLMNAH